MIRRGRIGVGGDNANGRTLDHILIGRDNDAVRDRGVFIAASEGNGGFFGNGQDHVLVVRFMLVIAQLVIIPQVPLVDGEGVSKKIGKIDKVGDTIEQTVFIIEFNVVLVG